MSMLTMTPTSYTPSLHDALPISFRAQHCGTGRRELLGPAADDALTREIEALHEQLVDRKSTRLNSSHLGISYAVFCLKQNTEVSPKREPRSTHLSHQSILAPTKS